MSNINANNFLMGGGKSASFKDIGKTVAGVIKQEPEVTQQRDFDSGEPAFWDKDKTEPKMQLVITLLTQERDPQDPHDDGERKLYVASPNMRKAIAAAVRAAGRNGLAVGGALAVTYTHDEPKTGKGNPPKGYSAQYVPPTGEVNVETGAAVPASTPAPATTPPAPPAPQPQAAPQTAAPQPQAPAPQPVAQQPAQGGGLTPEALTALQALTGNQG